MDAAKDRTALKPYLEGGDLNADIVRGLTSPKININPSTLELTLTGPAFSLRWTAPEVLNNGVQDLPSDMWAVGWICWEVSADVGEISSSHFFLICAVTL